MIIREVIQILNQTIYRNYSDKGYQIRNKTTGMFYTDVNSSVDYEYEELEPDGDEWQHPDYSLRIIAPQSIATDYPALLYELTVRRKLPIEEVGDKVHIYCNEILQQDIPLFQQLADILHVEDKEGIPPEKLYPFIKNTNSKEIHDRMNAQAKCNIDKITSAIYLTAAEATELINTGTGDGCGHCMPEFSTT